MSRSTFMNLYDAHCHLHDPRLAGVNFEELETKKWVVNGTCESEWQNVADLANRYPDRIIPSFGLHPWKVNDRSPDWKEKLTGFLEKQPAAVGEAGLDRWIDDYDLPAQEEAFVWQLEYAADHNLPISIHCLQAWGKMLELLQNHSRPERGFLLHSYGGSAEMVSQFADLGAYFSFCGYFLGERKHKKREAFQEVPLDRLLIETDAPDQPLPEELDEFQLRHEGERINHPGNLPKVYEGVAKLRDMPVEDLAEKVESNFNSLFQLTGG